MEWTVGLRYGQDIVEFEEFYLGNGCRICKIG